MVAMLFSRAGRRDVKAHPARASVAFLAVCCHLAVLAGLLLCLTDQARSNDRLEPVAAKARESIHHLGEAVSEIDIAHHVALAAARLAISLSDSLEAETSTAIFLDASEVLCHFRSLLGAAVRATLTPSTASAGVRS